MELIQNGGKQIKVWTDIAGIEPEALQQLYRMSRLPFIHDHIAVMPDVHVGKGATVGSVIATKGAIIPAAVGVDIGCFSGDTLITVIDGKNYKIKDLADRGEEIIIFACNKDNKIVAAKANAKLTRKSAKLIRVTLDNDEQINCTPDHKFMLRDGTYIEAELLSEGQSLMPFYSKKDKEGYTLIKQPYSGSWQRAHWVVARSGLLGDIKSFPDQKTVIHHKNFCESDNRPENLELMGDKDHSSYHRKLVERNTYWQSEDFERRRIEAIKIKSKLPERHAQLVKVGTENILSYMKNNPVHFKEAVKDNGKRGKQYLIEYNQSEKGKEKSKEIANRIYTCEVCEEKIKSPIGLHNHKKKNHAFNHKVKNIIHLDQVEDVYCLTVPEYNNFALSAGVFVHNCGMLASKTNLKASDLPDSLINLRNGIEQAVPVGRSYHDHDRFGKNLDYNQLSVYQELGNMVLNRSLKQIGTLGGGNHFIEICLDEINNVWIMLHSG
ncbi:MAG: RtcB family protein, partial [Candidatus Sericytochromatia bacterium]|nr:RtcB family protein [Candidatus Sericytochromatia bacterium]